MYFNNIGCSRPTAKQWQRHKQFSVNRLRATFFFIIIIIFYFICSSSSARLTIRPYVWERAVSTLSLVDFIRASTLRKLVFCLQWFITTRKEKTNHLAACVCIFKWLSWKISASSLRYKGNIPISMWIWWGHQKQ